MLGRNSSSVREIFLLSGIVVIDQKCFIRTIALIMAWSATSLLCAHAQSAATQTAQALPTVFLPKNSLDADELAVIVNDEDPLSVQIAEYYQSKRNIPAKNMIHIKFVPGATVMTEIEFKKIKATVDAKTPRNVQAYALTWAKPYRVDCMSITTAFAAGFDKKYCAEGCLPTKLNPYFNSNSIAPFKNFKLRPTMALAGTNFEEVKELIDRGLKSDDTRPEGTGYLLDTSDRNRNVRAESYAEVIKYLSPALKLERVKANFIERKPDVLFYFTGSADVPKISSNTFIPGAIADHLTSAGGQLTDSYQMSSLRWLEAGATGSYGAVVEPCNFPGKFPHPGIAMSHYLQGETLIEAYWKSVAMPGQGIFIGEPLAKPFGGYEVVLGKENLTIRTSALSQGYYTLLGANSGIGPYQVVMRHLYVSTGGIEVTPKNTFNHFYRIVTEGPVISR